MSIAYTLYSAFTFTLGLIIHIIVTAVGKQRPVIAMPSQGSSWVSSWRATPVPKCIHKQTTCYTCLISWNCDARGDFDPNLWYDLKEPLRPSPYTGSHALFIPQIDTHLGLTAGLNANSTDIEKFNVLDEADINGIQISLPPPMALHDGYGWHIYCRTCELTWMVGVEGEWCAKSHPAHSAVRDKRTLVCWAGVQPLRDFGTDPEEQYRAVYWFGPDSKFNGSTKDDDHRKALITTVIDMLRRVRFSVLPERCEHVAKRAKSNSEVFLEKARIFRLVVVISDPDLIEFIIAMRTYLWWKPKAQTYRTLDGNMSKSAYRFDYVLLHEAEKEIEALSEIGIFVSCER